MKDNGTTSFRIQSFSVRHCPKPLPLSFVRSAATKSVMRCFRYLIRVQSAEVKPEAEDYSYPSFSPSFSVSERLIWHFKSETSLFPKFPNQTVPNTLCDLFFLISILVWFIIVATLLFSNVTVEQLNVLDLIAPMQTCYTAECLASP